MEEKDVERYFGKAKICIVLEEGFSVLKKCIDECPECASYADSGETLMHVAARSGTPEMIEYIANAGGNVNSGVGQMTPLCIAVYKRKMDNVMKLLELGADVESEDSVASPVLSAVLHSSEILKVLIKAGADLTHQYKNKTRNDPWWNALTFAMYRHCDEEAEIIREELKRRNIDFSEDEKQFKWNQENLPDSSDEDIDYETYVEENLGRIVQCYDENDILELFWGGVRQVNDDTAVGVYGILPEGKDYGIVITEGMSEYPMADTDEGLQYAEVMMKIPRQWLENGNLLEDDEHSWVIEILCKTAYLGHVFDGAYVDETVIIPYGEPDEAYPFDWDYEFTAVMICPSEDIPALQTDEETKIKFYTLVPITEAERKLVEEKGSEEVKRMLSSGDMVDFEREILAES